MSLFNNKTISNCNSNSHAHTLLLPVIDRRKNNKRIKQG